MEEQTYVLSSGFGGLGDNLGFSTLPELYAKRGTPLYLWDGNPFRNSEIKKLVWDLNPFLAGTHSGPHNVGFSRTGNPYRPLHSNLISSIEMHHGFDPTNLYPKIYYVPKKLPELVDSVVVDVTAITRKRDYPKHIGALLHNHAVTLAAPENVLVLGYKETYIDDMNLMGTDLFVENIFHMCDIIYSCKAFISLHSGASFLASTIVAGSGATDLYCFIPTQVYDMLQKNGNQAIFDNCKYITIPRFVS